MLPIIQLTVVVTPTAAVARAPSRPTMAASTYCTAVLMACSSMVGQAKAKITGSMAHLPPFSLSLRMESLDQIKKVTALIFAYLLEISQAL